MLEKDLAETESMGLLTNDSSLSVKVIVKEERKFVGQSEQEREDEVEDEEGSLMMYSNEVWVWMSLGVRV